MEAPEGVLAQPRVENLEIHSKEEESENKINGGLTDKDPNTHWSETEQDLKVTEGDCNKTCAPDCRQIDDGKYSGGEGHVIPKPTGKNFTYADISLKDFLYAELTRGYYLEHDEAKFTEKRERVYTFIKIPRELEKLMIFGFFQCLDAFLYIFTFLPMRFLMALIHLVINCCLLPMKSAPPRLLEPAQTCDLLKGFMMLSSLLIMNYVDVSMMYHIIRGQAIIKLYIFFNMLEVADRLFSSFGQDILDSLFWTATEPRGRKREHIGFVPHLLLAIFYVVMHAMLVLFQATTLNVAFNSHNKALLTIMMSNNFVELKGSVFKKFEKNNLFQMSCSDVRERFHLIVLMGIVCIRNLTEFSWNMDHLWVLIPDVVMVILCEFLVDWVKHAFITKFNDIPAEVYSEYRLSIAYDMTLSRQKNAFSDLLDVVSRRLGFIPLPLAVLLVRVISQSVKISTKLDVILLVLFYLCLFTFKVLNSIVLLGEACNYIEESKKAKSEAERKKKKNTKHECGVTTPPGHKRSKSLEDQPNVTDIKSQDTFSRTPSLTPKPLFSNSTVSLPSVTFHEELIKEGQATPVISSGGELKKRKVDMSQKPLHEIDRYTMCSNRII